MSIKIILYFVYLLCCGFFDVSLMFISKKERTSNLFVVPWKLNSLSGCYTGSADSVSRYFCRARPQIKYRTAGPENTRSQRSAGNEPVTRCFTVIFDRKGGPIWKKSQFGKKATWTLEEAAAYSGIGINKLRQITDDDDCEFVLWIGTKRLIKRRKFDEYIEKLYSI